MVHNLLIFKYVAPHVGAWIEILMKERLRAKAEVAPHVGAWIEIAVMERNRRTGKSHPTWVRGLKLIHRTIINVHGVAPHVGAWIEIFSFAFFLILFAVAPHVGAWIEISEAPNHFDNVFCRTPRGCVD